MDIPVDIRQLRYFIAVAEELHFGRAARRLHIEQPPLSQQIQRLERVIGCRLFERKPKVALTEAGKTLLSVARTAVSQVVRGVELTRHVGSGSSGSLSIGYASSAVLGPLPEIIGAYRAQYPDVSLRLHELSPEEEARSIAEGRIDVGFTRESDGSSMASFDVISRERFGVLLPGDHPLASKKSLPPAVLSGEPFVHFPRQVSPVLFQQISEICRDAGFSPRVVQQAGEWLTEIRLVEAGIGIAIVPASVGKIRLGGVTFVPLRSPMRSLVVLSHAVENVNPRVSAFVEIARKFRQ